MLTRPVLWPTKPAVRQYNTFRTSSIMATSARTIEEVLDALDHIIRTCEQEGSRQAYFALLYKIMTEAVRDAILAGQFEDGPRMEKLDVLFANRYLQAWSQYWQGQAPTKSWQLAFDTCKNNAPIVLQHLILGINAHINLDLGIAAALTAPGDEIIGLQNDFEKINDIIATLTGNRPHFVENDEKLEALYQELISGETVEARKATFAKIQDDCIRDVLKLQESTGLEVVNDGEFRRGSYWSRFVERTEGFVHEKHVGLVREHHCDRKAFAHAAREFLRIEAAGAGQFDELEMLGNQRRPRRGRHAAKPECEIDILADSLPGEDRIRLEHQAAVAPRARHRLASETDASRGGLHKSGNHVEQRGFPASRAADNDKELSVRDSQINRLEG